MNGKQFARLGAVAAVSVVVLGLALAAGALLANVRAGNGTAASSGAPRPTPSLTQEEIAARSSPRPQYVPTRLAATTAADVVAGLRSNPDWQLLMRDLTVGPEKDPRAGGIEPTIGAPVFVRGLGARDNDEWILPLRAGGETIAIAWVSLDPGYAGTGYVGGMAQWSASFPRISESDARRVGAADGNPVTKAELVWTYIRGAGDRSMPFWRLVRADGSAFFLFDSGLLSPATDFIIN